jgi:hypothetical protein
MYFNLASSLVTCHDNLLDSLEDLQCLVYEGIYFINAGNLRRAWFCVRRASTLTKFMGVHRRTPSEAMKQLDPTTHISCAVTWAHTLYLERYLSLLLGMPTAIAGITSKERAVGETDSEWLEKVHSDIFERIIERNQDAKYADFTVTQEIDRDLQRVASRLPTKWAPLEFSPEMDTNDLMSRVMSGQSQIVHYNLLTVLH